MRATRPRLLVSAAAAAALLAGCGSGPETDPAEGAATVTGTPPPATSATAAPAADGAVLAFPAEYGLPELTVPADARVVDYADGGGRSSEVVGVDQDAVLDSLAGQLTAAGFTVVRPEADADLGDLRTLSASRAGAGTLTVVTSSADAVTVTGRPPA